VTTAAELDRERVRRRGFYEFVRLAWPIVEPSAPLIEGKVLEMVARHCQAVTERRIKDLLINQPPGTGKSMIVSVLWPVWAWTRRPELRWIFGSFDPSLSKLHAEKSFDLMQSEWFVERWGRLLARRSSYDMGEYDTVAGGFRFSTSVGGKGTGRHAHVRVFDDPIKPSDTEGDKAETAALKVANDWWRRTMASRRVDPSDFASVGVMQRLHELDLSAQCIADGYQVVCLPMRFEKERAFRTVDLSGNEVGRDWRTEPGELLFPERFSAEAVDSAEKDMGGKDSPVASAQLQQAPAPPGGLIFKEETFQRFTPGVDGPRPDQCFLIIAIDCAFKDTESADHVAIEVWGAFDAKFYLFESITEHLDLSGTLTAAALVLARYPMCCAVLVEDKANGPEVIKAMRRRIANVLAFDPRTSKVARAHSTNISYQARAVYHRAGATWLAVKEKNLKHFPKARRDDDVDTTTMGVLYLAECGMSDFIAAVNAFSAESKKWQNPTTQPVLNRHFTIR
jgi:predicted phage terminase large subunit-like protein